ncbi:hypothetical protein SAMN05444162_2992 [Paenibacillaceae bacterium GAS479]|nr:hypothetical protein SAMN05444162_2992 [Paenibacillaceae bacterium GAS479]
MGMDLLKLLPALLMAVIALVLFFFLMWRLGGLIFRRSKAAQGVVATLLTIWFIYEWNSQFWQSLLGSMP